MDLNDLETVRTFAKALPWIAYLLILIGWGLGSLASGSIATTIDPDHRKTIPLIIGIFLTISGILNILLFQHPVWFIILGIPLFIPGTLAGHHLAKK